MRKTKIKVRTGPVPTAPVAIHSERDALKRPYAILVLSIGLLVGIVIQLNLHRSAPSQPEGTDSGAPGESASAGPSSPVEGALLPGAVSRPTPLPTPKEFVDARFEMKDVRDTFLLWDSKQNVLVAAFFDESLSKGERQKVVHEKTWKENTLALPRLEMFFRLRPGNQDVTPSSVDSLEVAYLWLEPGSSAYRRLHQTIPARADLVHPALDLFQGALGGGQRVSGKSAFSFQAPLSPDGMRVMRFSWEVNFSGEPMRGTYNRNSVESLQRQGDFGVFFHAGENYPIKDAVAFYYPGGNSLMLALFDDKVSDAERAVFRERSTLLTAVGRTVAVLVYSFDLKPGSGGSFRCEDIVGYQAYWPTGMGIRGFSKKESISRFAPDFEGDLWKDCSGSLQTDGSTLTLQGSGANRALANEQRMSWEFSLRIPLVRMP